MQALCSVSWKCVVMAAAAAALQSVILLTLASVAQGAAVWTGKRGARLVLRSSGDMLAACSACSSGTLQALF